MTADISMFQVVAKMNGLPRGKSRFKHTDKYEQHLKSSKWQLIRNAAIERANGHCERCGDVPSAGLEVHHLHYETLGDEQPDDVEALCRECHIEADYEREADNEENIWIDRIFAFADKCWGIGWRNRYSFECAETQFEDFLERIGEE